MVTGIRTQFPLMAERYFLVCTRPRLVHPFIHARAFRWLPACGHGEYRRCSVLSRASLGWCPFLVLSGRKHSRGVAGFYCHEFQLFAERLNRFPQQLTHFTSPPTVSQSPSFSTPETLATFHFIEDCHPKWVRRHLHGNTVQLNNLQQGCYKSVFS